MQRQVALWLLLFGLLNGCVETRVVRDDFSKWHELAARSNRAADRSEDRGLVYSPGQRDGWGILVESFEGPQRERQALRLVRRLQRESSVPDLWVQEEQRSTRVLRGRYDNADSVAAQEDLRQTRMLLVGGLRPYAEARLVELGRRGLAGASASAGGDMDLRQFEGNYSLQVAFFDQAGSPKFRDLAEQYAQELRLEGYEAFFYHGPRLSLVTVGLFTDADFVEAGAVKRYGPRVRELQERFPYNLGNGATIVEKRDGQKIREQPSVLVKVE